jgi:formylglycine-generating enzyme required for sulfatase activity
MQSEGNREGFSGQLHGVPLLDIIQMACLAQRTGCLEVQSGKKQGRIFLNRGAIVHAEAEGRLGDVALLEILGWKRGNFALLDSLTRPVAETIQGGWEHVLMEAIRKRDEREHRGSHAATGTDEAPSAGLPATPDLLVEVVARRRRRQQARRSKRRRLSGILGIVVVVMGAVGIECRHAVHTAWVRFQRNMLSTVPQGRYWQPKELPDVPVPAGEFVFQDGQIKSTRAFRIDATEVTVWQYALFLDQIGSRTDYDHPNQPRGKGHRSPEWDDFSRAAFSCSKFHGHQVTPNVPATCVDWFDAYAYARWRGRRLPTEEEWEKAGRGPSGWHYPWGNASRPDAANLAGPNRAVPGPSDVAAWKVDRSPYGAYDMAGNVSEWTASVDADGNPVIKGGNFGNENANLTRRILHLSPLTRDARIGFRTAVDEKSVPSGPSAGL